MKGRNVITINAQYIQLDGCMCDNVAWVAQFTRES